MSYDYMDDYEPTGIEGLIKEFKEKAAEIYKDEVRKQARVNICRKEELIEKEKQIYEHTRELDKRQANIDKQEKDIDLLLGSRLAKLLTDLKPNQRVFYITTTGESHKCPVCNGQYQKDYEKGDGNNIRETCGHCSYGHIVKTTHIVKSGRVSHLQLFFDLRADYNEKWGSVLVRFDSDVYCRKCEPQVYVDSEKLSLSALFRTQEDADKECAKRQKESDEKFNEKMGVRNGVQN